MAIKLKGHILRIVVSIAILCFTGLVAYAQDTMQDAIISVTFSEKDNTKTIVAKAVDQSGMPIADLELYFYVERTFSLLPIGDSFNFTDEEGNIEVEFPNDLPGDNNRRSQRGGTLIMGCRS
jgi:hypothetical protein